MKDIFAIYKTPKMKRLLNKILSVVIIFAVLYAVLELIAVYSFNYMAYIGSSGFTTVLVIIIFSWVGYLILNNRFRPEMGQQPRQGYRQTRQPQRRPPARPLEYQEAEPVPIELEMGVCNYCGREFPTSELEDVVYENRIYKICRYCINE